MNKTNTKKSNRRGDNEAVNQNIHPTAIIESNCIIEEAVSIDQYTRIRNNCIIGNATIVGQNVFIAEDVEIGKNCEIQNNVYIISGVICKDDVYMGPSVVFTNLFYSHLQKQINHKRETSKTIIEKGVKIGGNATILCGCTIGQYAFISSGSVVTSDVKEYAIIAGNPAKQIGWISEHGSKMNFLNKNRTAVCPKSGYIYKLDRNLVRRIQIN
jgi:UDP-2-acetamido-3-amino-2,3-dideoxy-glucuronate N-acetyltransferase